MIRRTTITPKGISVDTQGDDREDAITLTNCPAWHRFYLRRLQEERAKLSRELESVKSESVITYRELQARIQTIDEMGKIPYRVIKAEKE